MSRVILAPKATLSSRQLTRESNCEQREKRQQHIDSAEAMQVRQRLIKVARRLGLVFGVRSRSTAEETLVIRSSMRKSPAAAAGARPANKAKKTVRFDDTMKKSSSKKMVKRTVIKCCRYVSLGALCSSPVLVTSFPTEPNLATSHRSSWSAWTEPVTWSHGSQLYM
ncbi:uncharacterized protein LOC142564543 [Dermacentor variabilis]|uniref:uncharacterized protein LOC142564543 n=1 Tax=Dermacentor variabilis TaxID=34621 RepID=UPI003F5BF199